MDDSVHLSNGLEPKQTWPAVDDYNFNSSIMMFTAKIRKIVMDKMDAYFKALCFGELVA